MRDEITYPIPNVNGATVKVWEWISNFIPHFIMEVITYPCLLTGNNHYHAEPLMTHFYDAYVSPGLSVLILLLSCGNIMCVYELIRTGI